LGSGCRKEIDAMRIANKTSPKLKIYRNLSFIGVDSILNTEGVFHTSPAAPPWEKMAWIYNDIQLEEAG